MALLAVCYVPITQAQQSPLENALLPDQGKLPLTAGFTDIDGAGGGGLVPWALITGYGTSDSFGANLHYTDVPLTDYRLRSYGVAAAGWDRVEVSATQHKLDSTAPGIDGLQIQQKVFGVKLRLTGDAVYDQDSWAPQTAVGYQYRKNSGISNISGLTELRQLGARADSGSDYYLSATKVYLGQSVLVDVTLRYSNANELGLLGFGGDRKRTRSVGFETTVAYLITRTVAAGAEYRERPHNLGIDDEHGAWDAFVAWTITRNVSVVGGFVDLGSILGAVTGQTRAQKGAYLSLQVGF